MLIAHHINVQMDNRYLLQDVSLIIMPGQLCAVIGANGAGKSTLFKTLCGDIQPTSGMVTMNNQPLNTWSLRKRAQIRAALPQQSNLRFAFSVLEVVLMGRSPHPAHLTRDHTIAHAALARTHAEHLAQRDYTTLSSGEQQRVQLARVLAQIWESPTPNTPRYLLLDEPTANLDLAHQHNTLNLLKELTKNQVGILVIVHDVNLAATYADVVVCLKKGKLLAQGTPQQVLTPHLMQEAFAVTVTITCLEEQPFVVVKKANIAEIN